MTKNCSTIDVEKENKVKNVNVKINILRIYTILYNMYLLLYFKEHNLDDK